MDKITLLGSGGGELTSYLNSEWSIILICKRQPPPCSCPTPSWLGWRKSPLLYEPREKLHRPNASPTAVAKNMGRLLRQRRLEDSFALPNAPQIARRKAAEKLCPQSTEQTAASHPSARLLQWPPCGSRSTVCHRRDLTDGDSEAQSPSKFPLIVFLFKLSHSAVKAERQPKTCVWANFDARTTSSGQFLTCTTA